MLKDKKSYQREYMRRRRSNKGLTKNKEMLDLEPVRPTKMLDPVLDPYPAVVRAMADPIKRAKLRKICQSLSEHNVANEVRYGLYGPSLAVVGEYLVALK